MKDKLTERLWILTKRQNKISSLFDKEDEDWKKLKMSKLMFITNGEILCLLWVLKIMSSER